MKLSPTTRYCYAISVQNGDRQAYFIKYCRTKDESLAFAKNYRPRYAKKRATKPIVRIWNLIDTFVQEG